jgi:hypothetical protein
MYQTSSQKVYTFFINLISKYIVWITIGVILILYWFFPEIIDVWGKFILTWGPIIILSFGLVIAFTGNIFSFRKQAQQGIEQYEIIINKYEIYLADLIIYGGAIIILLVAHYGNADGVRITDLIGAFIFFLLANCVKQIFYKKIIQ